MPKHEGFHARKPPTIAMLADVTKITQPFWFNNDLWIVVVQALLYALYHLLLASELMDEKSGKANERKKIAKANKSNSNRLL